jgi:hypothetical protein
VTTGSTEAENHRAGLMSVRELTDALGDLTHQSAPLVLNTPYGESVPYVIEGRGLRVLAASWDDDRKIYVLHTREVERR